MEKKTEKSDIPQDLLYMDHRPSMAKVNAEYDLKMWVSVHLNIILMILIVFNVGSILSRALKTQPPPRLYIQSLQMPQVMTQIQTIRAGALPPKREAIKQQMPELNLPFITEYGFNK